MRVLSLDWNYLGGGWVSNTAIVPLSSSGKFELKVVGAPVDLLIDVQGYFTAGQTAGGGYVPLLVPFRLVDTRQAGQLPQAKLADGSTTTITATGQKVPAGATAIFVNFTVTNVGNAPGYLTPYAAGLSRPGTTLNFEGAGSTTAIGATVPLSPDGKFKVFLAGGSIDLIVDVAGYYTPPSEANGAAAFTPASTQVANGVTVGPGQSKHVSIAGGPSGVPAVGTGIEAIAANIQVLAGNTPGHVGVWPDDLAANPGTTVLNYAPTDGVSNFATIRIGEGGGVTVFNSGAASIQVTIDVQGWYSSSDAVVVGGQSITSRAVTLRASNVGVAGGRPWVTYMYRAPAAGFVSVPVAHVKDGNDMSPASWPVQATGTSFSSYVWDLRATLGGASATKSVLVKACYGETSTSSTICGAPWSVTLSTGEFAYSTASTELGPGWLSLSTGNFQLNETDASMATALGNVSVGRSLRAMSPNAMAATPASSVFGPGWVADLASPDAGNADLMVDDSEADTYLRFETGDGALLVYQATSPTGTYPISYTGVGDTVGDGVVVTRTSASGITMTEPGGTQTTWTRAAGEGWRVSSVIEIGAIATTSYEYDAGRVSRILAPRGRGVASCANPDMTPGCRSLVLTYGYPGAPAPEIERRLVKVELSAPQISGVPNLIPIASFSYAGSEGRLIEAWNPQITPQLKTTYTYYASGPHEGRLETIKPPGENAWTLIYDDDHRVSKLQREVPVGNPVSGVASQTATTTVVYGVPNSGVGLPSLTASATATWGQTVSRPVDGEATAIFPPSHEPAGTTVPSVAETDWKYATINYLGVNGRITNTAVNGAGGDWLIDTLQYNPYGNVIWSLDARNRAHALDQPAGMDSYVKGRPSSAERADLLATLTVYDPVDPVKVTDTYGPTHPVQLPSETTIHAREHTSTTYDEAAPHNNVSPTGGPYRLPTTVKTAPFDVEANSGMGADVGDVASGVVRKSELRYGALYSMGGKTIPGTKWPEAPNGADVPLDGWNLRRPTMTFLRTANDPTWDDAQTATVLLYDTEGRVIEERLPGDYNGTTPRTTKTYYYGDPYCPGVEFAGFACHTEEAATVGGFFPGTHFMYNAYGQIQNTNQTWTSGVKRVVNVSYDNAGRPTDVDVKSYGVPNSVAVPKVTHGYSPTTGRLISETSGSGTTQKTLASTYDASGQVRSYTDATGAITYYGYDKNGRLASMVDPKGATTFTYGSGDEHRNLVTTKRAAANPVSTDPLGTSGDVDDSGSLDIASAAGVLNFTGNYNSNGDLVAQGLPGGLEATTSYDNVGNPTALTYQKGTDTWASFTNILGALDRVTRTTSEINGTAASTQSYAFDVVGRLTEVKDTVTTAGSPSCTTRLYGFDARSNRTRLTTRPPAAGGACATSGGTIVTSTFDAWDRITSQSNITAGTYTYDNAGRTFTVPGSDAQGIADHATATGQLTVRYHANDMVASLDQGTAGNQQTTTFTLDPHGGRIAKQATTATAVAPALPTTTTDTHHYADGGDSPTWSVSDDGTTSTWTRNVTGLAGLAVTITGTGNTSSGTGTLHLANLNGDIIATTSVDGTANSITDYTETTEYGIPRDPTTAKAPYGWLGTHQRSGDALGGLLLMGVRLYNPTAGRFLTPDPIPGGNLNSYTYPVDPINLRDLDGRVQGPRADPPGAGTATNSATSLPVPPPREPRDWFQVDGVPEIERNEGVVVVVPAGLIKGILGALVKDCARNSFDGDTPVLMADGTHKRVDDIEVDDVVWATDPTTGEEGPRKVVDLIRRSGVHAMVQITLADGSTIDATAGHPFWVVQHQTRDGRWITAADLGSGDQLATSTDQLATVVEVQDSEIDLTAYNFTVAGIHTYHVGAADVLVHNCAKKSKKSGKEKGNDLPSNYKGANLKPGETVKEALERIFGKNPSRTGPGSDFSKVKKYLERSKK